LAAVLHITSEKLLSDDYSKNKSPSPSTFIALATPVLRTQEHILSHKGY